jgi:agmatine deiminase
VLATSGSITISSLTLSATRGAPVQSLTATVTNGPGNAADWVGLYPAGGTSATYNRLAYWYLNGLTTAPASGVTGATLTFTLPTTPGNYDVRLFLNNSLTVLTTSGSITVTP